MKVIILAAGKGERLMPLTKNTPKSLLEIKNGISVLESQLTNIYAAGIEDVIIVTGYKSEQIEAKIKSYQENIGVRIKIVFNPFYSISNNLMSLWFARQEMEEDFVILNGDDVFDASVLPGLLAEPLTRTICMVTDHKKSYDDEDMKMVVEQGFVTDISKEIPNEIANAESIGMIRVIGKAKKVVRKMLEGMVRKEESKGVFYLKLFRDLAQDGWPIWEHVIQPEEWSEIDFHGDMNLVREALLKKSEVLFG